MAPSAKCLVSLAVLLGLTCCCSPANAATHASKFNSARKRAEVVIAAQKNALLRSVTAPPSPPAPPQSVASNLRVARVADAALQSGPYCGDGNCDAGEDCKTCAQDCFQVQLDAAGNRVRCKRVGIMYSVWHWPAIRAMDIQRAAGKVPVTVEDVIRSRKETPTGVAPGARTLSDVIITPGLAQQSMLFHAHYAPQLGFYCLYKRRLPGTLNYNPANEGRYQSYKNQPDCANITGILRQHAQWLTAAGIDYVVVDATNLPDYNPTSDAIQLRPFEVLCEVWADLRSQGIRTPEIAIWQRVPQAGRPFSAANRARAIYPKVLNVYSDPRFSQVLMKDSDTRKLLFFIPRADQFDEQYTANIQSNGGANNIAAQYMWVNRDTSNGWNFMSFCQGLANISQAACNQPYTADTRGNGIPIGTTGSQMAVSPAYQTLYHSLTQQGTGTWEGLTFQKQFARAFTVKPAYLFISTWNELLAQAQSNLIFAGSSGSPGLSMGLESDDTAFNRSFVDVHGAAFSRDIEPSVEGGTQLYDIMASCVKLFKNGNKGCTGITTKEPCCTGTNFNARFKYVTTNDGVMGIRAAAAPDSTALYQCTQLSAADFRLAQARAFNARRGLLQSNPWFYTTSATCEGRTSSTKSIIGYIPTVRGGNFLRALRRCQDVNTGDLSKYVLNARDCGAGYTVNAVLGYVR